MAEPSVQVVHLVGQQQGQLNAGLLGLEQVDGVCGGGRLVGGVRGQRRWGAAGQVGLPRVAERQRKRWRGSAGGAGGGGAAGQQLAQRSLEVPHEERVDDGVHGAVAVAQPGDGVEEGQGDALAHRLGGDGVRRVQKTG